MENENLEIEKYEVVEPNENETLEYVTSKELVFEGSYRILCDWLLRLYFKNNEKESYKITKQFADLLKNKTIYTLVAGPINGLFVFKVTRPNGGYFFQIVDASGCIKPDNLSTLQEALRCIDNMFPKVRSVYSGPKLG